MGSSSAPVLLCWRSVAAWPTALECPGDVKWKECRFRLLNSRGLADLYQDPMLPVRLLPEILIDTLQLRLVAYTLEAIILYQNIELKPGSDFKKKRKL